MPLQSSTPNPNHPHSFFFHLLLLRDSLCPSPSDVACLSSHFYVHVGSLSSLQDSLPSLIGSAPAYFFFFRVEL